MLVALDNEPRLQVWTRYDERQGWLERIADVRFDDNARCVLTGHEPWFTLPQDDGSEPVGAIQNDHKPCENGRRRHAFAINQEKP